MFEGRQAMIINLIYDSSVTGPGGPPLAFQQDVQAVADYLAGHFTDDITIDLHVGFGVVNGTPLNAGNLGQSSFNFHNYSYAAYKSALTNYQTTADDATAIASLPSSDPLPGTHNLKVGDPLAAALGLLNVESGSPMEGWVGFSNTFAFDYTRADGITAGQYDFIGTVAHEITEVLGRFLGVGEDINSDGTADYFPLDLFHYASGVQSFTRGGYFSIDGGTTNLAEFSTATTGDAGDWGGSTTNDSFLAVSNPGVYNDITPADLRVMDIIGYHGYADDFGDDINFAWHVSVGTPQSGDIELAGDADWFRVPLTAGIKYSIQVSGADGGGGTLADPFVAIWDSAGNHLAQDNDSGRGLDAYLTFTPSTSGYYYVAASSIFGVGTGTYSVRVNVAPKDFVGDHIPVDVVSALAVDHLPTFLGGKHAVGLASAQPAFIAPNLSTSPALSRAHDSALGDHHASAPSYQGADIIHGGVDNVVLVGVTGHIPIFNEFLFA
jgi:hypothetical protein